MQIFLSKKSKSHLPRLEHIFDKDVKDLDVLIHYYNPIGYGDWFVIAGNSVDNDFLFYGLIYFDKPIMGYFTLNDLRKKELPFGYKIERDNGFEIKKLSEVIASLCSP